MWLIWGPPWCWTNPIQHFFPRDLPIDPPSLVPHETGKNSEVGHHQADKCTEGDDAIFNAAPGCMMKHPTWNITTRMAENPYNTLKDILNNNANNIQVNIIFEIAWFLFYPEQSLKNSCQTNVSVFFFLINSEMVNIMKQKEPFSMISWSIQVLCSLSNLQDSLHKNTCFLYKCNKQ